MKNFVAISPLIISLAIFTSCHKDGIGNNNGENTPIKGCKNPYSFNYNPNAETDDGTCKEMQGCLGYANGFSNSCTIGNTLNSQYWDTKMSQEISIQANFFNGVPATVYVLYEPDITLKNAYATPDGKILFGYYMFYYTVQTYGELPVAGVLAHEWGHRVQYTFSWQNNSKPQRIELEADAFSGFYMALAKQYAWGQIQSYFANVYSTGDYFFNSPSHHGTPNQRLQAAYLGVTTAIYAIQNNIQYSYEQLHNVFISYIIAQIVPRSTHDQHFREVTYPPDLTKEYLHHLFPKK